VFLGEFLDRTFAITNMGGGVLAGTVGESCADYSILSGGGSYNLSAGQTVTVTVRFAPSSTGTSTCTVATGSPLCGSVSLTGLGDNPPACSTSPSALDFGTVTVGSAVDTSFTITNTGGGTLTGSVSETCAHYSIVSGGGSYSLTAGQQVTVAVRFEPSAAGTHACGIETGGALCTGVSCAGVGENPPACSVSPSALDFGTVTVGSAVDTSFTIANTGGGTLTGSVSEACAHYSVVSGGGPFSLTAGQQVTVTVRFEPSAAGIHACAIETGGAPCAGVSCTGVGDDPPTCSVQPVTIDFGTVMVGTFVDTTFTITNTGGGSLSGVVSEACGPFDIVSGGGTYSLGAGHMRSVVVRFAPVSLGAHECAVETGAAPCSDVTLTGMGGQIDAVDELASGPTSFRLAPDTQNPLHPGGSIAYELPVSCHVRLEVYGAQGRRLATLIDGNRPAGRQTVRWAGRSSDGMESPSGVCFFRMQAGSVVTIKRMVLLR
jgi:cold shock CspA family protein